MSIARKRQSVHSSVLLQLLIITCHGKLFLVHLALWIVSACTILWSPLESHSRIKWGMLYCVIDELLQYEGECRIPQFLSQTQHLWNVIIWMPQHWIWSTCTCKSIHKVQLWNWIWVTVSAGTHPLVFRTYKRTRKATSLCGWLCVQKDDQVLARGECN